MERTNPDPIIAEVHAVRDALAAEADHDVGRLFQMIREREEKSGRTYVQFPPRRVEPPRNTRYADTPPHRP